MFCCCLECIAARPLCILDVHGLVTKSEQKPLRRITRYVHSPVFVMPCRELTAQECALLDCDWALRAPSDKAISVKSQPPPCSVFGTAAKNSAKSASEETIIHTGAPSAQNDNCDPWF